MLVCGQEFSPETLDRIRERVRESPTLSRRALSREVCDWLNWRDPQGRPRQMSCRKALAQFHARGVLQLPQSATPWTFRARREDDTEVAAPPEIAVDLGSLGRVSLVPVASRHSQESRVWKTWLRRYHYLRDGPLCGAQIRYLVHSERHGWVAALSFSAAAWSLAARDHHIGWSQAARHHNLSRVVCNSRFLIPPSVKVPNLASHTLGLALERLAEDWRERYGYEPVLVETFVERELFEGTCYRAANWISVGETQGRGRQDRQHDKTVPIKDVYLHPLCAKWQEILRSEPPRRKSCARKPQPVDWVEQEFGAAELGDERLRKRLCVIAGDFYRRPQANIPEACGSLAKAKAVYRFMGHAQVSLAAVLRPHTEQTVQRMMQQPLVLAVQDTTTLNYSAHSTTSGLGPINTAADGALGLHLHTLQAFTETGTPLGLMDVQCWARKPGEWDKSRRRKETPIEEKESFKWMKGYAGAKAIGKQCPQTRILVMGDRESDIYELFAEARSDPEGPGLVIRAERTRQRKTEQGQVWDVMASAPVAGEQEISIPRRGGRPARVARLAIRFAKLQLVPPRKKPELGGVEVCAVYALEPNAPIGTESLEWMLLTTEPVTNFAEAIQVLRWYTQRWGIEVFHRTLKSGCRIEDRQLRAAEGLEACLGIDLVVAWRIHHLTKLGRETPDSPCTTFLAEAEWKALVGWVKKNPLPPPRPPTVREAIWMIATLGGFLGRKGDGEPGTTCIWRGLETLGVVTCVWSYLSPFVDPARVPVSSNPGCG